MKSFPTRQQNMATTMHSCAAVEGATVVRQQTNVIKSSGAFGLTDGDEQEQMTREILKMTFSK